jgi:hypothetical protein
VLWVDSQALQDRVDFLSYVAQLVLSKAATGPVNEIRDKL